jgi:hypothetical protein
MHIPYPNIGIVGAPLTLKFSKGNKVSNSDIYEVSSNFRVEVVLVFAFFLI